MRKLRTLAVATVVIQVGLGLFQVAPASATPTCSFSNGTLTIADDTTSGQDRIDVWQDTSGQVWASQSPVATAASPGTFCSGTPMTVSSITSISITGGGANTTAVIWMSKTPAATTPSPPSPAGAGPADWGAITWTVDLGSSQADILGIVDAGATSGLALIAGDSGIDLNADGQVDVTYSGLAALEVVVTSAGPSVRNVISAAGDQATGGAVSIPVALVMLGNARDKLTGGDGSDLIKGAGGNDLIKGGGGNDALSGGSGNDKIAGDAGNDKIKGGFGRDVCSGGPGRDKVSCEVARTR